MDTIGIVQDDIVDGSVSPVEQVPSSEEYFPYFVWRENDKKVVLIWSWTALSPEQIFLQWQARIVSQGWARYIDHLEEEARVSKEYAIKRSIKEECIKRQSLRMAFLHC